MTDDITAYTRASIFSEVGKQTPCLVRFSTVAGERGAADAERDIRGFAMKFYTDEGNRDLVGINTPVFFLRDPLKFPRSEPCDKTRSAHRDAQSLTRNWDFWTLLPEASPIRSPSRCRHAAYRLHSATCTVSGSHTYSFINKKGNARG